MTSRLPASKVLSREALIDRYGPTRVGALVFTNGVFDVLHPGHVAYLTSARALGDALIVGVNTDASTRRLGKGPGRPIQCEADRAVMVGALESVDAVCLFDDDTPASLIGALLPDVLVKGGDYDLQNVVGREVVEAAGGRVELIPFVEGHSTSDLLERIREISE